MVVIGLLLIVVAGLAVAFAVLAGNVAHATVALSALGVKVSVSPLTLFVAGAVALLLLLLGFALIRRGAQRKARERRELKSLRKQQGATKASSSARPSPVAPNISPPSSGSSGSATSTSSVPPPTERR